MFNREGKRVKRSFEFSEFDLTRRHLINVACNRIKFNGLPDEIDEHFLKYQLLLYGRILFYKCDGRYHVFWFTGRGTYSEYHIQNIFRVVNPWYSGKIAGGKNLDLTEDNAVIVFSDINAYVENADVGLWDIIEKYAKLINQFDRSIEILTKTTRIIGFLTGNTRSFVKSAEKAIDLAFNGEKAFVIMEESLVDSIKCNPIADKMDYKMSELIKARQYYLSDFYQKIGVGSNQNMKKERLTDNESQLIESVAGVDFTPILDNINSSLKKVNDLFDLNITVELNEQKPDDNEKKEKEKEESSQLHNDDDMGSKDGEGGDE